MSRRAPAAGKQDSHPFARETGNPAKAQEFVDLFLNDTRTRDLTPIFRPFGYESELLKKRFIEAIEYGQTTIRSAGNDGPSSSGIRPDISAAFGHDKRLRRRAEAAEAAQEFEALDAAASRRQARPANGRKRNASRSR